jgi:hypothetical protein
MRSRFEFRRALFIQFRAFEKPTQWAGKPAPTCNQEVAGRSPCYREKSDRNQKEPQPVSQAHRIARLALPHDHDRPSKAHQFGLVRYISFLVAL